VSPPRCGKQAAALGEVLCESPERGGTTCARDGNAMQNLKNARVVEHARRTGTAATKILLRKITSRRSLRLLKRRWKERSPEIKGSLEEEKHSSPARPPSTPARAKPLNQRLDEDRPKDSRPGGIKASVGGKLKKVRRKNKS